MRLTTAAVSAAALTLAACVTNPYSGTAVAPATTSASFSGWAAHDPSARVRVEFEEADGSWSPLGEGAVDASNVWYATVNVPDRAWRLPPCGAARFRFVHSNGSAVMGQDAACLAAAGPSPDLGQRYACLVPTLELFRGQVHAGDLSITGQAQADARSCVTVVDGNLRVEGDRVPVMNGLGYAPGVGFALPNLEEVRGSLTVDGGRTSRFSMPRLGRVGGDLTMLSTQFIALTVPPGGGAPSGAQGLTAFSLPSLVTVGGSVDLRTARDGTLSGGAPEHDFGLASLSSVGADVRLHQDVFPARIVGLDGLSSIPRDLVYDGGATDVSAANLLQGLGRVGRDVLLTVNPRALTLLPALTSVGRHLSVVAQGGTITLGARFLPALETVGGEVVLPDVSLTCAQPALSSLRSVGGLLRLFRGRPEGRIGASGATPLVLGGLLMSDTSAAFVPLHPDASVTGAGPVIVTKNPNLCPCQVGAVAGGFAARGWTGVLQQGGNGGAAACGTCPAPTCP